MLVFYKLIIPLFNYFEYYKAVNYICPHADKDNILYYNYAKNNVDFLSKKVDNYFNFDNRINASRL